MDAKQVKTEAEESSETFDTLASVVNEYFTLKADLVKVEAEVYEFGRILQMMPTSRADKFKAQLWLAWSDMQKILKRIPSEKVRLGWLMMRPKERGELSWRQN